MVNRTEPDPIQRLFQRAFGSQITVTETGLNLSIHTKNSPAYRNSWFVVYTPEESGAGDPGALLAWEVEPNQWRSTWTFDPEWVHRIQQYIIENF